MSFLSALGLNEKENDKKKKTSDNGKIMGLE